MAKLALLAAVVALAGAQPHVVARIPTGAAPAGATAAFGAVWVANDGAGTIARIDPRTNRVTRRIRLKPGPFSLTHGFGALWVDNYKRQSLTRVDPRSGRARSVRIGAVPFDVVAAFGRIWATAWDAGTLVEVDPASLRVVRRTAIGPRPTGLAVADGALYGDHTARSVRQLASGGASWGHAAPIELVEPEGVDEIGSAAEEAVDRFPAGQRQAEGGAGDPVRKVNVTPAGRVPNLRPGDDSLDLSPRVRLRGEGGGGQALEELIGRQGLLSLLQDLPDQSLQ